MLQIKNWAYDEYPEYRTELTDATVLGTTGDEVFVSYHPDVQYAVMDGHPLTLQILSPSTRNDPHALHPVVLYVQGSAWGRQNVYRGIPELSRLAERGYVVALVQYRGSDVAPFPATLEDTRNAVRFMKLHAQEYLGDPARMVLAGCSSGGHAAVYAPIYQAKDGDDRNQFPGVSADVAGIVDFYGSVSVMADDSNPSTLDHCLPSSPEGREMGGANLRERPDLRRLLSVECHISKETRIPPVLILHGTKDRTVNPSDSEKLYRRLRECGKDAQIVFLRGADHGGAEFWTPQVLDIVDSFIQRVTAS